MLNILKKNINYIFLFLIFSTITHFFNDVYNIYHRTYQERLERSYGFCNGISYGYIKKIKDKFLKNEKKIYIINLQIYPSSSGLFPDLIVDKKKNNLILLNFNYLKKSELSGLGININEYKIINHEENCYYLKKI
jgi:hypothetical protein